MLKRIALLTLCTLGLSLGCGSSDDSSGTSSSTGSGQGGATASSTSSDSSTSSAATSGAGGKAELPDCSGEADPALDCGAPALCGYPVTLMASKAAPPAATGGTIKDGVYILTSYTAHNAPIDGSLGSEVDFTLVIKAPDVYGTQSFDGGAPLAYSGTLDTTGGSFYVENVCPTPSADTDPDPYSASDTEFSILEGDKDANLLVFTRVGDAP